MINGGTLKTFRTADAFRGDLANFQPTEILTEPIAETECAEKCIRRKAKCVAFAWQIEGKACSLVSSREGTLNATGYRANYRFYKKLFGSACREVTTTTTTTQTTTTTITTTTTLTQTTVTTTIKPAPIPIVGGDGDDDDLGGVICSEDGLCGDPNGVDRDSKLPELAWSWSEGVVPRVPENASIGYPVLAVPGPTLAKDTAVTVAATFQISEISGRARRADTTALPFSINETTGQIAVSGPLDFETTPAYDFDVVVTSSLRWRGDENAATQPFNKSARVRIDMYAVACPANMWSATGTYPCALYTVCAKPQEQEQPPSATSDRVCTKNSETDSSSGDVDGDDDVLASFGYAVLIILLVAALIATAFMAKRNQDEKEKGEKGEKALGMELENGGINPQFLKPSTAAAKTKTADGEYQEVGAGLLGGLTGEHEQTYDMAATQQDELMYDVAAGGAIPGSVVDQQNATYEMAGNVMPQQQPLEEALYATADETSFGADDVYGLATSLQMPQQDTEDMYDTANAFAPSDAMYDSAMAGQDAVYDCADNTNGCRQEAVYDSAVPQDLGMVARTTSYQQGVAFDDASGGGGEATYDLGANSKPLARTKSFENALDTTTEATYDLGTNNATEQTYDIGAAGANGFQTLEDDVEDHTPGDEGYLDHETLEATPQLPTKAKNMDGDAPALPRKGKDGGGSGSSFEDKAFQLAADSSLRLKSVHRGNPLFRESVFQLGADDENTSAT